MLVEFFNLAAASSAPILEYTQFSGWKLNIRRLEDFRAAATAAASSLRGRPMRPWDPASGLFLEPRGRPTGRFALSGRVPDFIMPALALFARVAF